MIVMAWRDVDLLRHIDPDLVDDLTRAGQLVVT